VKEIFIVILINTAIFFCIDFFFGKKILDFLYTNNIILSPEKIISQAREIKEKEKSYRIKNEHFHHTLASNIRVQSRWGNSKPYLTCTDKFGFRISCIEKNNERKNNKNIVFIGDSFTEGIGLDYEKNFTSMFNNYSENNIINMGVTSYSPIIYLKKIQYFVQKGLDIDHVIVFIDISDIDDEANYYYECEDQNNVCMHSWHKQSNINSIKKKEENFLFPLYEKIRIETKNLKRKIKPKIYIYRKNYKRSMWTHVESTDEIKKGINNSIKHMISLHNFLKTKDISLSVAVYPQPGQIIYDSKNSKQVKIWKNFCENKCKHFINLFPPFFDEKPKLTSMQIIKKYYIKNDIHFNELGNKKIFNVLKNLDFN
jgi:lysophospholipase L1-like esterase